MQWLETNKIWLPLVRHRRSFDRLAFGAECTVREALNTAFRGI